MYVGVDVTCSVVIDDCLDGLDVKATSCNICRDQQVLLAGPERVKHLHARELQGGSTAQHNNSSTASVLLFVNQNTTQYSTCNLTVYSCTKRNHLLGHGHNGKAHKVYM